MADGHSKTIFEMPQAEFRALLDEAQDAVAAEVRCATARHKARIKDPRSPMDYRDYKAMRHVCVLVVKHADKPASFKVSRAGDVAHHFYLPHSKMCVQPESRHDFVLATIPKWLAQKLGLMGIVPTLSDSVEWTKDQRDAWQALKSTADSINTRIINANRSRSLMSRNDAA